MKIFFSIKKDLIFESPKQALISLQEKSFIKITNLLKTNNYEVLRKVKGRYANGNYLQACMKQSMDLDRVRTKEIREMSKNRTRYLTLGKKILEVLYPKFHTKKIGEEELDYF